MLWGCVACRLCAIPAPIGAPHARSARPAPFKTTGLHSLFSGGGHLSERTEQELVTQCVFETAVAAYALAHFAKATATPLRSFACDPSFPLRRQHKKRRLRWWKAQDRSVPRVCEEVVFFEQVKVGCRVIASRYDRDREQIPPVS